MSPKLSLEYVMRAQNDTRNIAPLVILLHGYGSNEEDLFALADGMPEEFLVLSVRAPHTLTIGHYAWFSVDFSSTPPTHDKKEVEESEITLKRFINEVLAAFAVDPAQIYLVGFSQGAIMSYSVALTHPPLIAGIAALSGRIFEENRMKAVPSGAFVTTKFFIGHGTEDSVLSIDHARVAKKYLEDLAITPEYHEYPIGHKISKNEKDDLLAWLGRARS